MSKKTGILDLLASGPVIGDGSMIMVLEKRGYVRAGPWTPEATVTHPEAVRQLLNEYVWAGSDVIQTPTFHSSERRLELFNAKGKRIDVTADEINEAACKMALEVAEENNVLVCGGFSPSSAYEEDMGKEAVRREFEVQTRTYKNFDIDFFLGEFFGYIDEMEQCVEVMKTLKKPVACTMKIGPPGDYTGVSVEECAVRMAQTGADMIGVNCYFDVNTTLKTMKRIKDALKQEELSPYLMCQPVGWMCPEAENDIKGIHSLPESPFALDPRLMTRYEAYAFARSAYEMGINYIGGCCGCESHHIRAFAQELQEERKRIPPVNVVSPPYTGWVEETEWKPMREKGKREFWLNVKPGSGRPFNSACTEPKISEYQKSK